MYVSTNSLIQLHGRRKKVNICTFCLCSHYQIIVLRLTGDCLPAETPSMLYPSNNASFSNCTTVNDPDNKGPFQPYVAAELSSAELKSEFVVGGGKNGTGVHCNGPLLSGATYTLFVRAYPPTLAQEQQQQDRRNYGAHKQYVVFSSSSFLWPPVTFSEWELA